MKFLAKKLKSKKKKAASPDLRAETVKWVNDPESLGQVRALFPGVQVEEDFKYGELSISTAGGVVLAHTGDRVGRRISGEPYIIKAGRSRK